MDEIVYAPEPRETPTVAKNSDTGHNARLITFISLLLGPVLGLVGYSFGVAWRGGMTQAQIQLIQAAHTRDLTALQGQLDTVQAGYEKISDNDDLILYRLGRIERRLSIRGRAKP